LDVSDRTLIEITGSDGAKFLHNFCTNDINQLQPGQGCEAFVTSIKGKILAHVFVFKTETSVWLETVAGMAESICSHLDRYVFSEDVEFHPRCDVLGTLFLTGPAALDVLGKLVGDRNSLGLCEQFDAACQGVDTTLRRVDWLGQPGILLSAEREELGKLWQQVVAAGAVAGGAEAFHALRIEASLPLYGLDITEDNLAQEAARSAAAISFTKGCYLGQEPIARIDALGHVNRELRMIRLPGAVAPEVGSEIKDDAGNLIGTIKSATTIPGEARSVGLCQLKRSHLAAGSVVFVGEVQGVTA
jgi:folate-binding protein YgfZ